MTLQPIVPARPRPARCAELTDGDGPPDPSPPVQADFEPSHDAITAELLDLTWQLPTHSTPAVRAELGQFPADHGQPVAGLGAFLTAYSSAPHGTTQGAHTTKINKWGAEL